MTAIPCPRCSTLATETGWCERCQQRITPPREYRFEQRSTSPRPRRWKVRRRFLHTTAALMSLILPGAGQVYKGRVVQGIVWFVVIAASYWLVGLPALIVHLMCVITAGSEATVVRRPVPYEGGSWPKRPTGG